MPEIPEVEGFRAILRKALRKKIKKVKVNSAEVLEKVSAKKLESELKGKEFENTRRHGKYLFSKIGKKWIVLHFGMTGELEFIENFKKEPEYAKVLFLFSKAALAYICPRKFGKIYLIEDKDKFIKEKDLGPDALGLDFKKFYKIMNEKKGMLKTALMDQSTICGIGNEYSDEICFQTDFHPETEVKNFEKKDWKKIYNKMKYILEKAIDKRRENENLPGTWILSHRKPGAECPGCNGKVKNKKVGGRSSYFCPSCQKKK